MDFAHHNAVYPSGMESMHFESPYCLLFFALALAVALAL
jgi:hypothetical protein